MVHFTPLATALLAIASSLASALPTSDVAADLDKRQSQARVYYCEHIRWGGACRTHEADYGACHNLGDDWNDKISSIRNDIGHGVTCIWYEHHNCGASGGGYYTNQNDANLADGNGFWNDRISSWSCVRWL